MSNRAYFYNVFLFIFGSCFKSKVSPILGGELSYIAGFCFAVLRHYLIRPVGSEISDLA